MALGAAGSNCGTGLVHDRRPRFLTCKPFWLVALLAQVLMVIGVVQGNVMNLYSAYMSTVTIFSSIRRAERITSLGKFLAMAGVMTIATLISLMAQDKFQAYFSDVLNAMIYLLVPWSAINLADYYVVRKGHYDLAGMFDANGIYGAYRWATIGVFALAVAAQTPFMSLSFYQGPLAKWIGSDVAWVPGLLIPAALYVCVERRASVHIDVVTRSRRRNRSLQ